MKKVIVLSLLIMGLTGMRAMAQTAAEAKEAEAKAALPVKTGDEWQMPKDVLTRSKNFTENLQKKLGLDDATSKKVFNAYLGNTKSVDEIRVAKTSEREKKEALAAKHAEFNQVLKGILTPEQFEKYLNEEKTRR
ncbi:MAG: hypothetical protein M3O71_16835 [Bacteroidota bacterium]|nr:hypothetical protein [Bacteroidota bacterium]